MTTLTNQLPENTYGDLLTTTNGGQGLGNALQPVQDGLGNNSPVHMSRIAVQFSNIMAIPVWETATRPADPVLGAFGLNSETSALEIWNGTDWVGVGVA